MIVICETWIEKYLVNDTLCYICKFNMDIKHLNFYYIELCFQAYIFSFLSVSRGNSKNQKRASEDICNRALEYVNPLLCGSMWDVLSWINLNKVGKVQSVLEYTGIHRRSLHLGILSAPIWSIYQTGLIRLYRSKSGCMISVLHSYLSSYSSSSWVPVLPFRSLYNLLINLAL
jgi:hypothetical protein